MVTLLAIDISTKMNTWNYWLARAVASTRTPVLENGFRNSSEGLELAISRCPNRVSVDLGAISAGGIPMNNDFVGCANSMPTEMTLEMIQIKINLQDRSLNFV